MIFQGLSILVLSLLLTLTEAQQPDELSNSGRLLKEEFGVFFDDAFGIMESDHPYLRRELQTGSVCQPVTPLNVPLPRANINFCNELPNYPCSCSNGESSCTYCMIRVDATGNGIRCQVSGSSVTFLDGTNTVTTCGCQYLGNGQVHQYCYQDAGPVPMPAPSVVIAPPPAPVAVRVPIPNTVAVPAVPAPGRAPSSGKGKGKGSSSKKI